jgi:hypothetical protein
MIGTAASGAQSESVVQGLVTGVQVAPQSTWPGATQEAPDGQSASARHGPPAMSCPPSLAGPPSREPPAPPVAPPDPAWPAVMVVQPLPVVPPLPYKPPCPRSPSAKQATSNSGTTPTSPTRPSRPSRPVLMQRSIALSDPLAAVIRCRKKEGMGRHEGVVIYVLALIAVVVGVDVLFFRNRFWERLMANVGIVLVFWAFYLRFLKRR